MSRKILCYVLIFSLIIGALSGIALYKPPVNIHADEVGGIEISVLKVWDDYSDFDGLRPESIDVTLYQNNERTNVTVTLSEDNDWYYKHDVLVAENDQNGDRISYTWECDETDGYERYTDTLENMYIITDVHHYDDSMDSVVLQSLNENDEFFDGCSMRLKDKRGNTLITWTTNNESSIDIQGDNVNATMNDDGSLVVEGLPAGEYVYEDISTTGGYTNAGSKEFKIEKENQSHTYNCWYTSFEDAARDANDLTTDNADCYRDDKNCKVGMFIVDDTAKIIFVDDTVSDTVTLNVDTSVDFNNNTLTLSTNSQIYFKKNLSLMDGTIEGNSITVLNSDISSSNYSSEALDINDMVINNEYVDSGTDTSVYTISSKKISEVNIINSEINSISTGTYSGYSLSMNYAVNIANNKSIVNVNNSSIVCDNSCSNTYKTRCVSLYFKAEKADITNSEIIVNNTASNENSALWYQGGYNKPVINIINNHIVAKSYFTKMHWLTTMGIRATTHNELNIHNNNVETLSHRKTYGMMLYNQSGQTNHCDMQGNTVRAMLSGAYDDCEAVGVINNETDLHIKGDYIYADPSLDTNTEYNGHYSSKGYGLDLFDSSKTVIDESEGTTTIIGGNYAIHGNNGSDLTINAGTFKSPNYGCGLYCGAAGHLEINGGLFRNNNEEYPREKLKGIHNYSALYVMSGKNALYEVNISNATIIGGTYGLNIKGYDGWYGSTCHLFNCNIRGNSNDIFLSSDTSGSGIANSYCYIENGTTLFHDGTENTWYDMALKYGFGQHIIDNRQQETTTGGE